MFLFIKKYMSKKYIVRKYQSIYKNMIYCLNDKNNLISFRTRK